MTLLAIDWGGVGIQALYLLMALSLLVILHELGHFIPAKLFGCRVEKFFLFFDAGFSLFKKKVGETVYGIGWLPLGGYVKISGMIDESMDKEAMKEPPKQWEFRSKPAWQRLIIMVGGVTVNVIVAFIIYAMILFVWGDTKTPTADMKTGIQVVDSLMYDIGLKDGDKVLSVDGKSVTYFEDAQYMVLLGKEVTVERDGKIQLVKLPVNLLGKLSERRRNKSAIFIPQLPVVVEEVVAKSPAAVAGLKQNDRIVGVDSISTPYFDTYRHQLMASKGRQTTLQVERGGKIIPLNVAVNNDGTLGFYRRNFSPKQLDSLGIAKVIENNYSFFEAIPAGAKLAMTKLGNYIDQFKKILSPETEAYKGVSGFKGMASIFPDQWGAWQDFWSLTAFLSIVLAFMNILPIPALDGGHVLFLLYEMVTRRRPSDKFLEYAQIAGMVILLGLMLYANGNDWFGWGRNK
ncbi:RIP metalloprotease RseP [Foetidibacter luteolus]|uniref:RIP metalloprotease RseP n=1 Tax=Foetidibacter luteolus TaxID=2608880 RepID=UPI00129AE4B9|nr:RIP metalloprotease RseP [Foetidibacter luteolus]